VIRAVLKNAARTREALKDLATIRRRYATKSSRLGECRGPNQSCCRRTIDNRFHAYYQNDDVVAVDTIEVIAGGLPRRPIRLVEAWAELHQEELIADWQRLQTGQVPLPIAPLE